MGGLSHLQFPFSAAKFRNGPYELGGKGNGMIECSTKDQIIKAAVDIMARKGKDSSIVEIAAAAGVNVSHIYHYFKNKEDLLFHSIGAYIRPRIPIFEMKLQGIREPMSLLTKLIWEQQHYHKEHTNYAKFSLFECRSRQNFFHHEAFSYVFYWARIMKKILKDGQKEGIFSRAISATVARDTIQGLLDMEDILYFAGRQEEAPFCHYDAILDLLLPMIVEDGLAEGESGSKSEVVIQSAETLFAEKGYARSTTLEIAKMSCIAERTLYDYFENKEDILFSTLQYRFKGHIRDCADIFHITRPIGKLRQFIYHWFTIYLRQPHFVKTFVLDGIFNPNFYHSKAYADFESFMQVIDDILVEGKTDGSIASRLDNRLFKNMFLGIFTQTMLRWYFSSERSLQFDMAAWINEVTLLLTRAVLPKGFVLERADLPSRDATSLPLQRP